MATSEGFIYSQQPCPCIILLLVEHIVQFHSERNLRTFANEHLDVIQVWKVGLILSRQHLKVTYTETTHGNFNDIIIILCTKCRTFSKL